MGSLTIVSFLGFTVLVAVVTWLMTRGHNVGESRDGYFLGGRSLTWKIIAGSIMMTQISAFNLVGLSSQGYVLNMSSMSWSVAVGLPMVIVGLYFMPKYLKQGITTIPDFIEDRFDGTTRYFIAILFILSYFINLLPVALYTGAMIMSQIFNLEQIFGLNYATTIWITVWTLGIVGGCYAIFGGLRAIAISDTLNGIGLIVAGCAVPILALSYLGNGSFASGLQQVLFTETQKLNSIGNSSSYFPIAIFFTGALLMNIQFQGCDQSQIQRTLGARSLADAQKGYLIAAFLKMLTPVVLIVPGIIAFHIYKGKKFSNPDLVYSTLVNDVLPKPMLGFFAAVVVGAILSTFNSVLNSAATLITLNVIKPISKKEITEKELVVLGRNISIILAVISMLIAPCLMYIQGIYQYFQVIVSIFAFPMLLVIIIGYTTKRIAAIAVKAGMIFFLTVYVIFLWVIPVKIHFMHLSFILFVISAILVFVIGIMFPRETPYEIPEAKVIEMTPWRYRKGFSWFLILLMIGMYLLFSPAILVKVPIKIYWPNVIGWTSAAIIVYALAFAFYKKFSHKI